MRALKWRFSFRSWRDKFLHNLLGYDRAALTDFFTHRGHKPYRAAQVFRRLHAGRQNPPDIFADLPKPVRAALVAETECPPMPVTADHTADDGARKLLFQVAGGSIESVLIPERTRLTLCISSQAGCALACRFCLTGKQGFSHNLTAAEIIGQLRQASAIQTHRITNVVMMGMGEPLLNLEAVLPALRIMTDAHGYALAPRRVTVSTAGIVPAMARLGEAVNVSLAVSLHAPEDDLRNTLMPINRKYPLADLMEACRRYLSLRPRSSITFEYVMLRDVNDDLACARALVRLLHGVRAKVNLIPFNPFDGAPYTPSSRETILKFRQTLVASGVVTTIRKNRGGDISAACGQLAGDVRARTGGLGEMPLIRA